MATLVAVVLGAHLGLLAGGIGWPPSSDAPATPGVAAATAPPASVEPAALHPPDLPSAAPVRVSTVRWIVPVQPPPAPAPAPVSKPKSRPKPVVRPAPVVLAESAVAADPVPAADTVPDMPAAIEAQADTEPPIAQTSDTAANAVILEPAPTPATTVEASAPAPEPATTAASESTPAMDEDARLAAASNAKPRQSAATAQLPPAQPPGSMRLQYDVTGNIKGIGYKAHGALDWTAGEGRYEARLEMRVMLLGSRSQTSTGRIGPSGLAPERFADKSRSEKATHFDAAQQRIRFSSNAPEVPLQLGAQDRLSLFMQLAGLLQARPQAYTSGQTIEMQVAGTGDAPVWRFDVGEESTLQVPAGEFRVRHIVRQPRKEFDSTVEMWLAPSLGHMPVRLRIAQSNGDFADQKLMQMP